MTTLAIMLVVILLIATVGSLFTGLVSMGVGGRVDDRNSNRLMFARVGLQALAVGAILLVLFLLKH